MKLQNGFELEGNINYGSDKINDAWTQVLIIESTLEVDQLRELFKDNNSVVDANGDTETTYFTNGLIDVKTQDGKNYVWLYFDHSNINSTNQKLKSQLADVLKSDLNFETIKFLYSINQATKDDVFSYVKNGNITQADYLTITGENCPELPLDVVKQNKTKEMSAICENKIINEFYSSCRGKGYPEKIDCTRDDQNYINGLYAKAQTILSGATTDGITDWKISGEPICYHWEPSWCFQLGLDMFAHITSTKKRFEAIRQYILNDESLTDTNTVLAIKWDDTIPDKYFSVTP